MQRAAICSNVAVFGYHRASTLSNAVSSLANTGMSFTKVDEREKQAALEEEQARLKALKVSNRNTAKFYRGYLKG